MKSLHPRLLIALSIVSLASVFLWPLWQITLEAAQFPEGLHLNIWINKFSGSTENIIHDINILNHYVGMQAIEPDSIPELRYFPIVIIVMMALGLVSLFINRRSVYLSWTVLMLVLSIAGVYDFYLWMYDYGHNLDPAAPIKVPGQTYMPPLFGEKDLLNFYVKSYPRGGTIGLGISLLFSSLAWWNKKTKRR